VSFEIKAEGVDVAQVMRVIRERIAEKKRQGLYTDEELREIAGRPLEPVLDPHQLRSGLLEELLAGPERWNYAFDPQSIYRSSRGGVGKLLEAVRRWLRPLQRLFWNPTPMISALSRQADLNTTYVHLIHNVALEMTRLNLEVVDLKNRVLQLQGRLEFQTRREKALEDMLAEATRAAPLARPRSEEGGDSG